MSPRLERHLHQAGYSLTQPRRLVINYLSEHGSATSADLAAGLAGQVNRATVFRTLGLFRQLGIVHDVGLGPQRQVELADRFGPHHHHLVCSQCGRTISFESHTIEELVQRVATNHGYQLEQHHLELVGRCPKCQATAGLATGPV